MTTFPLTNNKYNMILRLVFISLLMTASNAECSTNTCQKVNQYDLYLTCSFWYDLGFSYSVINQLNPPINVNASYIILSQKISFNTGTDNKVWRVTNNKGGTSVLYASWTPPDKNNIKIYSSDSYDGLRLTYGQRWELKSGEGQNVQVIVDKGLIGNHKGTVYMWWESGGKFIWDSVYEFSFDRGLVWLPAVTDLLLN